MSLIAALQAVLGPKGLITDHDAMAPMLEDWRGRSRGDALCIARPATTEQVCEVVRLCAAQQVPVLAQGGNTGLVGGSVPAGQGPAPVIINLERMRTLHRIDTVNNSIEVDAGCVLAAVQEAAREAGRLYPVSLGAEGSCQVGGTIATNAGGISVLRYGNTRENVLGLEVVLADGSLWSELRGLRKDNTGYDLKHLFIGSEGTLGIITRAVLKLHPLPTASAVAWVGVQTVGQATELLVQARQAFGPTLSAFELMNQLQLDLVVEHVPDRRAPLSSAYPWHVLIEVSDMQGGAALDDALTALLEKACEQGLVDDAALAANDAQRQALWEIRHSVSEANKKAGVGLTTDCAVPASAITEFVERSTEAIAALAPTAQIVAVGHMGDGNIHFIPFFTHVAWQALPDQAAIAVGLRRAVNDIAFSLQGTFSAEHGVGQTSLGEMSQYKSSASLALMRAVKKALDPAGLFNPGRLLPPEHN